MSTTACTASTALVSLSLNGNIYRLPTSKVQPCVDMLVAMDRTFTNVLSKQSEKGLVWTYVAEGTKGRRFSNAFLNLYVDVDNYPVYGLGGVSRTVFASSVALTADTSQTTLAGSRHAMDYSTKAEAVGKLGEMKKKSLRVGAADAKVIPHGQCNDPRHNATIADMAQALLELDELKLANAKLTARVESLIPKWLTHKLDHLERDVVDVEQGVDAVDFEPGSRNVQDKARVGGETSSSDLIAEPVPEPVGDSLDFITPPLPATVVSPSSPSTPHWDVHAAASEAPEESFWNLRVPPPSDEEVQSQPQNEDENKNKKNKGESVIEVLVEQDDLTDAPTSARPTRTHTSTRTSTHTTTASSTPLRDFHIRTRQRDAERAVVYATINEGLRRLREIREEGEKDMKRVYRDDDGMSDVGRRGSVGGSVLVLEGVESALEPRHCGEEKGWPGIHEVLEGAEGVMMRGFGEGGVGRRGEDEPYGRDKAFGDEKVEAKGEEAKDEEESVEVKVRCGEEKIHQEHAKEETQVRCIVPVSVTVELSLIDEQPDLGASKSHDDDDDAVKTLPEPDPPQEDDCHAGGSDSFALKDLLSRFNIIVDAREAVDAEAVTAGAGAGAGDAGVDAEGDREDPVSFEHAEGGGAEEVPKDKRVDDNGDGGDDVQDDLTTGRPAPAAQNPADAEQVDDGVDPGEPSNPNTDPGEPVERESGGLTPKAGDGAGIRGDPYSLGVRGANEQVPSPVRSGFQAVLRDVGAAKSTLRKVGHGGRSPNEQVPSPVKSGFQAVLRDVGAAKSTLRKVRHCCEGRASTSSPPSTPARPRSRLPLATPSSSTPPTGTVPAGKKQHPGVSAILGFNTTAPELLERKGTLTRVGTQKQHPPSSTKSGFQLPKLRGTGRLSNGAWKPTSGGENVSATPPRPALRRGLGGEGVRVPRVPGRDRTNDTVGTQTQTKTKTKTPTPTPGPAGSREVQDLTLLMPRAVSVQFYSRKR